MNSTSINPSLTIREPPPRVQVFRSALVASAFALFWSGSLLMAWLVLPIATILGRNAIERTRRCQKLLAASFRVFHAYMHVLRLVEVRVQTGLTRSPRGPVVFVANHPTLVDVTAIVSVMPEVCCVVKHSLAANPVLAPLFSLCGFIAAGGGVIGPTSTISQAVNRLDQGFDVLVFPEGTRSPQRELNRFQRGAFEIASRARVPVVPLILRCEPSALSKGRPFWRHPKSMARLSIGALEPLDAAAFAGHSAAFRDLIENRYRQALGLNSRASGADS